MSTHSIVEGIRISEAYVKMTSRGVVCESEDGYSRIREYPVLANEDEDKETVPFDASDDGSVDESGECGDDGCEDCHYVISECEGGETLYDSLIDGDVGGFVGDLCRRRRAELSDEWDSADDIRRHIIGTARSCKPGKCVVIRLTGNLPICVKRLSMPRLGRTEAVFEGVGDMSDEEFAKWWESLTPEQREAEIAKLPDDIADGNMSDEDIENAALRTGATVAGLSAALRGGPSLLKKAAGKAIGKKVAANVATKTAAKAGAKAVGKTAGKTLGKSLLKKIPGVGALAGLGFGIGRLYGRDADGKLKVGKLGNWVKAGGEVASGLASTVPGLGTAASAAIDGGLAYSDVKDALKDDGAQSVEPQKRVDESDTEYPVPSSELFEKKTYDSARRFIRKTVDPLVHGMFSDEDWSNVHRVFKEIRDLGVNLNYGTRNDGYFVHGYQQNGSGMPTVKAYEFEIKFTNVAGRKMKVCGQLIASGTGTVENPMSKYDIAFQLY